MGGSCARGMLQLRLMLWQEEHGESLCWVQGRLPPPKVCSSVLSWLNLSASRGFRSGGTGLGLLTPPHIQSWWFLDCPSALSVQTVLPLPTTSSLVHLHVPTVHSSSLKVKFLDVPDLWVPSREEAISSFFLLITLEPKCFSVPIWGFFMFVLGMEKGGAECNEQQQREEADPISTHRPTGRLGGSPHPFFNLFFNWSVKPAMLWMSRQGEALHSTPGASCMPGGAGRLHAAQLPYHDGREIQPSETTAATLFSP